MAWHQDDTETCAVEVVDEPASMFRASEVAYAVTESGSIVVNNHARLDLWERYATAVHEIGHLLGLEHNRSARSVMFYMGFGEDAVLDKHDTQALAKLHKLRIKAKQIPIGSARADDDHGFLSSAGSSAEWVPSRRAAP